MTVLKLTRLSMMHGCSPPSRPKRPVAPSVSKPRSPTKTEPSALASPGEIALLRRAKSRLANAVRLSFSIEGVAGQSFGAFAVSGMTLELEGLANDFVGKGLCGGELILRARGRAASESASHTLLGNVALYGATGGSLVRCGACG